jgi:hypothetical protein
MLEVEAPRSPLPETEVAVTATEKAGARYLVVPLIVTTIVWIPLFVQRVYAHQPNTDDYGYAVVSRHIAQSGDFIRAILDTGKNAPLVPTLGAPGFLISGFYGIMAVELPILLLLVAGAYVLARVWLSPRASMVTCTIVGLNAAILGYSMMLNFALASTAGIVWTFAAYLKSNKLRDLRWSIVLGVAFVALVLARSMAPVYAIPFIAVVVLDLILEARRNGLRLGRPAKWTLGIIFVFAGPWWLISGPTALQYLSSAGYQPSAGFAKHGATLTPSGVVQRVNWELANLGWIQAIALGIAIVASIWLVVRHWRERRTTGLWMLTVWAVVTIVLLSTSTNRGTGFGLPVIAIVIVLCAVPLGQQKMPAVAIITAVAIAVLIVGIASQFTTSTNSWWHGPPYRVQVLESGGSTRTNIDVLSAQVARAIGTTPTLMAQNDRVLNWNSLRWQSNERADLLVPPQGPHDTGIGLKKLHRADLLITGNSPQTFEPSMNESRIEEAARAAGFVPIREWKVTPRVDVVLWRRIRPLPTQVAHHHSGAATKT